MTTSPRARRASAPRPRGQLVRLDPAKLGRLLTPEEHLELRARAMLERDLLDGILGTPRRPGVALARGWRGYHTHRSQHSPAGFPDLALVRRGRLVFAELKDHLGKASDEQTAWLDDLAAVAARTGPLGTGAAVEVYLWRPLDLLDGTIARVLA